MLRRTLRLRSAPPARGFEKSRISGLSKGVDALPNDHRGKDREGIRQKDEQESQRQPAAVLPEEWIQCRKRAHGSEVKT